MAADAPIKFTDEEIAALEATFTFIARVPHELGFYEIVICAADRLQWQSFMAAAHDDDTSKKARAQAALVRNNVVGIAWRGEKVMAGEDSPAAFKPVRDRLDKMVNTRGFAGACDGPIMSRQIMRLNNGAIEHAEK